MMKKWAFSLTVLAASLVLASCGAGSVAGFKDKDYTEMDRVERYGNLGGAMLGISPDGEKLVIWTDDEIKVLDADTGKEKQSFECEAPPRSKKALWNGTGDAFVLGDAGRVPSELQIMIYSNISVYGPEDDEQLTDVNVKAKITDKDAKLLFSPTWSADGKDVLYCTAGMKGSDIVKVEVKSGDDSTLFHVKRDKMPYVEGIELKDGLLLCEYNGAKRGDNDVFLYDVKSEDKTSLKDVVDKGDYMALYEIKGWSEDRKTVLVNKWIPTGDASSLVIQKCIVLTFTSSFKDYSVKTVDFSLKLDEESANAMRINPLLVDKRHGNNRLGYASILSPGGRYILTVDRLYEELDDMVVASRHSELVLHDLKTGEDHMLYTNDEDEAPIFGISSPLNGNAEGMFMTRDGKLLLWLEDGYSLFELEP